jgi:hypothetical protein
MVAMGLELSQLCLGSNIQTLQIPWSLNLLWSKPQCWASPLNDLIVVQPGAVTAVDTMPHQTEHGNSV